MIITLENLNNFYISGNRNECPPQLSYLLIYFTCHVNMTSLLRSWHWWAATASAACVARLGAVADWWLSWPMANTLVCLCLYQWWTFWTYLVTVNLFSLYLMNFMFHTMLDAVSNILRVHYKSMKCDVSFSQGSVSTLFTWGEHVFHFHACVKCSFCLQQCKNYENQTSFSRLMITNVLPPSFMKHRVQVYCIVHYKSSITDVMWSTDMMWGSLSEWWTGLVTSLLSSGKPRPRCHCSWRSAAPPQHLNSDIIIINTSTLDRFMPPGRYEIWQFSG